MKNKIFSQNIASRTYLMVFFLANIPVLFVLFEHTPINLLNTLSSFFIMNLFAFIGLKLGIRNVEAVKIDGDQYWVLDKKEWHPLAKPLEQIFFKNNLYFIEIKIGKKKKIIHMNEEDLSELRSILKNR